MRAGFDSDLWRDVTEAQLSALVIDVHHEMVRDGERIPHDTGVDVEMCMALQRRIDPALWYATQKWLHPDQ